MLSIFLPLAEITASVPGLGASGFIIGFSIGLFGVGGGFLLIPILKTVFGIPYPVAVGSGLTLIFLNGSISAWKHFRGRNVDLKLGTIMAAGALAGTEIGVRILAFLNRGERIALFGRSLPLLDIVLSGMFLFLLTTVCVLVLIETSPSSSDHEARSGLSLGLRRLAFPPLLSFPASRVFSLSLWVPLSLSLIVGILTGLMGVGGGFVAFPLLIYIIGVPTHVAIGTGAFNLLFAGGYGAFRHALQHHVELLLVGILFAGSIAGIQLGVFVSRKLTGRSIRRYFALVVAAGIVVILWDLVKGFWL